MRQTNSYPQGKRSGFTLIEIMVALFVAGMLCGLSVISFQRYQPTLELSGAVRELSTNLRYAQQLAISRQINHGLRLDSANNEYQIIQFSSPEQVIETISISDQISVQETTFSQDQAEFNIYGAAIESGYIVLSNQEGTTSTVEVKPSGFVKITK